MKFGNDENFAIHSSTWQSGTTDAKGKWCVSIWLAIWNTRENIIVLFQVCDGFSQAENPCMTLQFIWYILIFARCSQRWWMMCQYLIGDMKHTWKHNRTFSGVWRLFSGWKSVYDTAVYMIHTNICKMFPEMFDPAGAIIAYLWLAIWWIGYLPEIISRHKEGTYHGFWLYSDRLFNVKSLLRMCQPVL